jgi:hypothetical protein
MGDLFGRVARDFREVLARAFPQREAEALVSRRVDCKDDSLPRKQEHWFREEVRKLTKLIRRHRRRYP